MARKHFVGKAGHLAVMAELAWRGYNVALPEIDIGDDIFVLNPTSGTVWRVQVKTASGKVGKRRVTYQFRLPLAQMNAAVSPRLVFVFAGRRPNRWHYFAISSAALRKLRKDGLGSKNGEHLMVTFSCTRNGDGWLGKGMQLDTWIDTWKPFPALRKETAHSEPGSGRSLAARVPSRR